MCGCIADRSIDRGKTAGDIHGFSCFLLLMMTPTVELIIHSSLSHVALNHTVHPSLPRRQKITLNEAHVSVGAHCCDRWKLYRPRAQPADRLSWMLDHRQT